MNLNEIKEALSKATAGPWYFFNQRLYSDNIVKNRLDIDSGEWIAKTKKESDGTLIANAPEWLASLVEHYEECAADAIVLQRQVEEMQKTIESAYNIACEEFESVNQMELIRLTLGESLQSLKGTSQ